MCDRRTRRRPRISCGLCGGLSRASRLAAASDSDNQAAGFRVLLGLLGSAREQLDKLDPFIPLAEAELLWEKDNPAEAGKAMEAALSLNPSYARTWSLLGEIKTAQFDLAWPKMSCSASTKTITSLMARRS